MASDRLFAMPYELFQHFDLVKKAKMDTDRLLFIYNQPETYVDWRGVGMVITLIRCLRTKMSDANVAHTLDACITKGTPYCTAADNLAGLLTLYSPTSNWFDSVPRNYGPSVFMVGGPDHPTYVKAQNAVHAAYTVFPDTPFHEVPIRGCDLDHVDGETIIPAVRLSLGHLDKGALWQKISQENKLAEHFMRTSH